MSDFMKTRPAAFELFSFNRRTDRRTEHFNRRSVGMRRLRLISGFRRDVHEICCFLGYYAASSNNPLPTFRDNVSISSLRVKKYTKKRKDLTLEDGTDTLSRNVGKGLPHGAA
jgi:hypothetical protein